MKLSILLVGYREEKTVGRAIDAFLSQEIPFAYEILLAAPDAPTACVMQSYAARYDHVRFFQDPGQGKPTALNLLFREANGEFLILSDSDVYVGPGAVAELLRPFVHSHVGAVCGRPISLNSRQTMLGYFSHLLTDIGAHHTRLKYRKRGRFIECSGYLYALRNLHLQVPVNALSEDAVISHMVAARGFTIMYAPHALVFVQYPTTLRDWFIQKRRSAGGYVQLHELLPSAVCTRSFTREILEGCVKPFMYPRTVVEFFWTLFLYPLRLLLWILIFVDVSLRKKSFSEIWLRVKSTK